MLPEEHGLKGFCMSLVRVLNFPIRDDMNKL